jgi:hypothetical protein
MQVEMERGGRLFFDLFVAMCNHMVSLSASGKDLVIVLFGYGCGC